MRERRLLRWAEWPYARQHDADLPATYGESLEKTRDQMSRAMVLYMGIIATLQMLNGFIRDASLIDKLHLQLRRSVAVGYFVANAYWLKAFAFRLLDLAIYPEGFWVMWPKVLSGLATLFACVACASTMGMSKWLSAFSTPPAEALAIPLKKQAIWVGAILILTQFIPTIMCFDIDRVLLSIRETAVSVLHRACRMVALGLFLTGLMTGSRVFGLAIRGELHATNVQQMLAGFAGIVLALSSMTAYHHVFMRPTMRRLSRPELWPAWIPWG